MKPERKITSSVKLTLLPKKVASANRSSKMSSSVKLPSLKRKDGKPKRIRVKCLQEKEWNLYTHDELKALAKFCRKRNKKRCKKNKDSYSLHCHINKIGSNYDSQRIISWLKYNPALRTYKDYSKKRLEKYKKRFADKKVKRALRELLEYPCPAEQIYLDLSGGLYFHDKYRDMQKEYYYYLPKPTKDLEDDDFEVRWINEEVNECSSKDKLVISPQIQKAIDNFKGRWMVIPVYLKSGTVADSHSQFLIYYPTVKRIYKIEPAGYFFDYYNQKCMDRALKKYFKEHGLEYVSTVDLDLREGPAAIYSFESDYFKLEKETDLAGYCLSWTYYVIDYLYRHPELQPEKLLLYINKSILKSKYYFLDIIRKFTSYMNHYLLNTAMPKVGIRGISPGINKLYHAFMDNYSRIYKKIQ